MKSLHIPNYIRENYLLKNVFFSSYTLFKLLLLDVLLAKALYGIKIGAKLNIFNQVDLSKLTLSQFFEVDKVRKAEIIPFCFIFVCKTHHFIFICKLIEQIRSFTERKKTTMSFPLLDKFITTKGFVVPMFFIKDSTFWLFINLTLKANDKSFILMRIDSFPIFNLKRRKWDNNSIDFGRIKVFENRRTHKCPLFAIVKQKIVNRRSESTFNVISTDHRTNCPSNSLSCSGTSHPWLNWGFSKNLTWL